MGGQAMAETVVVAVFFLVPFFLMIVIVGKYIDMRSATLQAARYAAFERTVYNTGDSRDATMAGLSDAQLANGIRLRFFSGGLVAITQAQNDSTSAFANKPLWVDQGGNQLLADPNSVAATADGGDEPFGLDTIVQTTIGTLNTITDGLLGYSLTYDKYYTANVSATPQYPIGPKGFVNLLQADMPALQFSAHDTLLADGWSASDMNYEHDQAARLVPTAALGKVLQPVIDAFGYSFVPDLGPESGGPPDLGYVNVGSVGSVPADRLKDYNPPGSSSGGGVSVPASEVDQIIKQYEGAGYALESNVTNSDGTVTLTFTQGPQVMTVTLGGPDGTVTNSATEVQGDPYDVAQQQITTYTSHGYKVDSETYLCSPGSTVCNQVTPGWQSTVTEVDVTLELDMTTNGHTVVNTLRLTVKADPNKPGYSIVTAN
jgi:hypothetical protein